MGLGGKARHIEALEGKQASKHASKQARQKKRETEACVQEEGKARKQGSARHASKQWSGLSAFTIETCS